MCRTAIDGGAESYQHLPHFLILAPPGSAILNVFIASFTLAMPHIKLDQIWHFGMAKVKEAMISMGGGG